MRIGDVTTGMAHGVQWHSTGTKQVFCKMDLSRQKGLVLNAWTAEGCRGSTCIMPFMEGLCFSEKWSIPAEVENTEEPVRSESGGPGLGDGSAGRNVC